MKISVFGTGYVGLVTGACLANLGHDVLCVDIDEVKIVQLQEGKISFYEPELPELVAKNVIKKRLKFGASVEEGVDFGEVVFNCVGTPGKEDGSADLQYVFSVARSVGKFAKGYKVLVNKSTVPPGTANKCDALIKEELLKRENADSEIEVVSNPEFLAEGKAVYDFSHPNKIVVGAKSSKAFNLLRKVYTGRIRTYIPFLETDWETAETIKYANNSFLATKIGLVNELANICDKVGADVRVVTQAMGMDYRISPKFLQAGTGYGGSCVLGDSLVFIKNQGRVYPLPIREVFALSQEKKLEVLSFDAKTGKVVFNKIITATKREFSGNLITVRTKMNKTIVCTDDHPFVVLTRNTFVTKLAKELSLSDWLPSYLTIPQVKCRPMIDVISKLDHKMFDFKKIRVRPLEKKFSLVREIVAGSFAASRRRDILRSNCMNLAEFLHIEKKISKIIKREDLVLFTSKGNTTYCPAIIKFNEDFCTFLGYYLSKGNIHYERGLRGIRARIQIHFNHNEEEYINEVKEILRHLHIRYAISHQTKNSTKSFVISSRILAFVLDEILQCGKDSYTADVPKEIFSLNKKLKLAFLRATFKGDGHIAFPKNTNSAIYDFGSVSFKLVHKMILLFHSLGIVPSYKTSRSKKSTVLAQFFRISTKKQIMKLPYFKDKKTQDKLEKTLSGCKDILPCGFKKINNDYCVTKIKEIISKSAKVDVYSLEVEKSNTFITDFGLIVHNCFPKDVRALLHKGREYGYESSLLREVDLLNERQKKVLVEKVKARFGENLSGKTFTIWGLSFKPKTSDIREAPALVVIEELLKLGAKLQVYDPIAVPEARKVLGESVTYCDSLQYSVHGSSGILLITEWDEFRNVHLSDLGKSMVEKVVFDGRNIYEPELIKEEGFEYVGVGRR